MKAFVTKNEIAGKPAPRRNRHRRQEMISRTQPLFAPDQRADERAFQKEGKHALHRQSLPDHAARVPGKARPVRPELKLHGNAGDDPDGEIQSEDLGPEAGGLIVLFVARPQGRHFQYTRNHANPIVSCGKR